MTCWVIIPAKAPEAAKGRLAGVLDAKARHALAAAMLNRSVSAAQVAKGVDGLALVGPSRLGLPDETELLAEPEGGLNAALTFARSKIARRGASRLVSLAGDLPGITPEDVEQLCSLPDGTIGIAPDRHGTGTNALSLPLPAALTFAYSYGPGSSTKHRAEAARLGLPMITITTPGLARDVDEPDDLADAAELLAKVRG